MLIINCRVLVVTRMPYKPYTAESKHMMAIQTKPLITDLIISDITNPTRIKGVCCSIININI